MKRSALLALAALALTLGVFCGTASAHVVPSGQVQITCSSVTFQFSQFPTQNNPVTVKVTQAGVTTTYSASTTAGGSGTVSVPITLSHDGPVTVVISWTADTGGSTTVTQTLKCAPPAPPTTTTTVPTPPTTVPVHTCAQLGTCPVPTPTPAPPAPPVAKVTTPTPLTDGPQLTSSSKAPALAFTGPGQYLLPIALVGMSLLLAGLLILSTVKTNRSRRGLR